MSEPGSSARYRVTWRRIDASIRQMPMNCEDFSEWYQRLDNAGLSFYLVMLSEFGTESVQASVSQLLLRQYLRCSGRPGEYHEDMPERI